MREDELSLRQVAPQRLGVRRNPRLRGARLVLHELRLLIVDVDAVQVVALYELRHALRDRGRVAPSGRRQVVGAKSRDDDGDSSVIILVLELLALRRREVRPVLGLVVRAVALQEAQCPGGCEC